MDDTPAVIRVQHLVKKFGDVTAVDDVSFDVRRAEIFAFLGPNGAGKTTTIRMLTTLLQPTSGAIELDGLDPTSRRNEVRQRIGVVFQDPSLDQDLTAWENMEIHGVLYGVASTDPATFVGVTAVLLGVAALGSWLPARRAAIVDPAVTLRSD